MAMSMDVYTVQHERMNSESNTVQYQYWKVWNTSTVISRSLSQRLGVTGELPGTAGSSCRRTGLFTVIS
jgi:hypothetical protein